MHINRIASHHILSYSIIVYHSLSYSITALLERHHSAPDGNRCVIFLHFVILQYIVLGCIPSITSHHGENSYVCVLTCQVTLANDNFCRKAVCQHDPLFVKCVSRLEHGGLLVWRPVLGHGMICRFDSCVSVVVCFDW